MRIFRRIPLTVEAFQVPARDQEPSQEMVDWLHHRLKIEWEGNEEGIVLHFKSGPVTAWPGDWMIYEVRNARILLANDNAFALQYEEV